MQELMIALLPVAAASGWYAARKHYTKKLLVSHTQVLRQAYVRGLNYLLSEKTDKAIDTLAKLLASDCETIETHIALGNLFRRRGELEKAIEIHENLINQDNLSEEQRTSAHFELGLDYLRSGLLDRAESILTNLVDHPVYCKAALQQLLQIFQQEKDWRKAMECTRALQLMGKVPRGETVAQFLCELAEEALREDRLDDALTYVDHALKDDSKCIRATLLKARMQMRESRFHLAVQILQNIESQDPAYLREILEPLGACYEHSQQPAHKLIAYLSYLYETFGCEEAGIRHAEQLKAQYGPDQATEYLQRILDNKPSLKVLHTLTDLLLEEGADKQRSAVSKLNSALYRILSDKPRYRCVKCGFSGTELHWRCPSCRHWESTRPI